MFWLYRKISRVGLTVFSGHTRLGPFGETEPVITELVDLSLEGDLLLLLGVDLVFFKLSVFNGH